MKIVFPKREHKWVQPRKPWEPWRLQKSRNKTWTSIGNKKTLKKQNMKWIKVKDEMNTPPSGW